MEVAASAAGIVSLGIQTCQGLIAYYTSWKNYKSDITEAYDSIALLEGILLKLQGVLEKQELLPEQISELERCVVATDTKLANLAKKLRKIRTHEQPKSTKERVWSGTQRLLYPFTAKTLSKLVHSSTDIQNSLTLAIQVVQLDVSSSTYQNTEAIRTSIAKVEIQGEQLLTQQQLEQQRDIIAWLDAPNPWTNHLSARQQYENETGSWLLSSREYQSWRSADSSRTLWLYGKAGCGKTVLCSTAIEDLKSFCLENDAKYGLVAFYFSFSDARKQTYRDLLLSSIVQLNPQGQALSLLSKLQRSPGQSLPTTSQLEEVWQLACQVFERVYILIDGLDECAEAENIQQDVLGGLQRLLRSGKVSIFATSRMLRAVDEAMSAVQAVKLVASTTEIDLDIETYLAKEMIRNRKLAGLDAGTKALIRSTIGARADGMFRWAACQVQTLKRLKALRPSIIQKALNDLPNTLDETYARILADIDEYYQEDAFILLQWLAYSREPLSLIELRDTVLIDHASRTYTPEDQGNIMDSLEILGSLINMDDFESLFDHLVGKPQSFNRLHEDSSCDSNDDDSTSEATSFTTEGSVESADLIEKIQGTKVRLAHFSVKEYLEASRTAKSTVGRFHLQPGRGHEVLAHSCLTYLAYHQLHDYLVSKHAPLLQYAAQTWYFHSALKSSTVLDQELELLTSPPHLQHWTSLHRPDEAPTAKQSWIGTSLYYAACVGHAPLVQALLAAGHNVNCGGRRLGSPLQAAASKSQREVVKLLLAHGADANLPGGTFHRSPLQAASWTGDEETVEQLITAGADVNFRGGFHNDALETAATRGHVAIVRRLLAAGADVTTYGIDYHNALRAASMMGNETIVRLLLDAGIGPRVLPVRGQVQQDTDSTTTKDLGSAVDWVEGGILAYAQILLREPYGSDDVASLAPLVATVAQRMLDLDADDLGPTSSRSDSCQIMRYWRQTHVTDRFFSWVLDWSRHDANRNRIVRNLETNWYRSMLKALLQQPVLHIVTDHGRRTALHFAAMNGHLKVLQLLLERGADVNAQDFEGYTALHHATLSKQAGATELLLARGADHAAVDRSGNTALHFAASVKSRTVTKLLVAAGADVNQPDHVGFTPLHVALALDRDTISSHLLGSGGDPFLMDGYGQTSFEYIRRRQDSTFAGLAAYLCECLPTNPQPSKLRILLETSSYIITSLLDCGCGYLDPGYNKLARCLLQLGYETEVVLALESGMLQFSDDDPAAILHFVTCDECKRVTICGVRHACIQCPDLDLCDPCMRDKDSEVFARTCGQHRFIAIPASTDQSLESHTVSEVVAFRKSWLQRLQKKIETDIEAFRYG